VVNKDHHPGGKMTINLDDFYTKKHKRLSLISTTANVFSWLVLIFFILATLSQVITFFRFESPMPIHDLDDFETMFVINSGLEIVSTLFQGFVFYLVLRGVFFGTNMIIETDLNYREIAGDNPS
jgi:magnesium-transporting ATPase (P-type)